jgi:predicted transcriptional regulator
VQDARLTDRTLGEQELLLLRHVAAGGPATVGEVVETFGSPRGLARNTVLTMMERLRRKGWLTRRRRDGVYRYASPSPVGDVLRGVVSRFVERALGGSISPFVAYMSEEAVDVGPDELAELERLVARLRRRKR